jgi:hypothetical protein
MDCLLDYRHDLLVSIFRVFFEGEIQGKGDDVLDLLVAYRQSDIEEEFKMNGV